MNTPGRPDGNWTWRIPPNAIADEVLGRLKEFTQIYGRD
jgi:4-alpha-glucanotransferase